MASLCVHGAAIAFAATVSMPLGALAAVGRTPGMVDVSPTGVASYSVAILAPPGTHGMTPTLSLSYSHTGGSGWIGEGWDVGGLSAIARCPKTWAQDLAPRSVRLDYDDRYCLDGSRLRLVAGTHGANGAEYRTEIEDFSRIKSWGTAGSGPAYFVVEMKNGLIYEYGNTSDSRIESLGVSSARAWAVNKIRDRDGNAIAFAYVEDATNGGYRLDNVQYTSNPNQGLAAAYKIQFVYDYHPPGEIDAGYWAGRLVKDITRLAGVDVTYNTAIVRRYNVAYEPALSNTGKSRVQSIQECAGSAGTDCLSATTFTYQNGTPGLDAEGNAGASVPTTSWTIDVNGDGRGDLVYPSSATSGSGTWMVMLGAATGYGAATNTGISNVNYSGAVTIDYNADGFDDLLVPYSGGTWWVMLGTASGLAAPVNTGAPATATGTGINAHAIDVDGDGLQDLVWADLVGFAGGDTIRYRLRVNGGAFSSTVGTLVAPMPVDSQIRSPVWGFPQMPGARNPDFDGDGREDFIYLRRDREFIDGNPSYWRFTHYTIPVTPGGAAAGFLSDASSAPVYGDFNGDGMTDLLYVVGAGASHIRFATGTGFTASIGGPNPDAYQNGWQAYDWNGDGFDDLLARNVSTGAWSLIPSSGEYFLAPVSTGISSSDLFHVTEINGDGLPDVAYKVSGVWKYRLRSGSYPDLLLTATDGFGNAATFAYTSIVQDNHSKNTDATFPEQDYAGPMQVVRSLTGSDGIGGTYTVSYWYYGARVHLQGRGFEGFYARLARDSRNGLYAYDYFQRLYPYTGSLYQSDLYQSNNSTLISRVQNSWTAHSYGSGTEARFLPYVSTSNASRYEFGGTSNGALISTTATTNTVDSATGTLSDSVSTTTEAATANGVQAGAQYTQRIYLTSLSNDQTNWCIGRPGQVQQINSHTQYGGASITRTTSLTWDMSKCRVTQDVTEPGNAQLRVTRDLGYDGFGNLNSDSVTGAGMSARTTTANWGSDGRFAVTVTNALSQQTQFSWNAALGVVASQTDPNGIVISWQQDVFGRRTRETRPDGTATTWSYNDCTSYSCVNSQNKMVVIETDLDTGGAFITDRWAYTDRFDRPIAGSGRTLSGAYSRVDRQYDALGRIERESAPCWSSGCAQYWTTFSYDALDRTTSVSRPRSDGDPTLQTTNVYYEGLTTRVIDAMSKQSTKVANVIGGPARSIDHDGYYQNFENDAFGNVVRVTDSVSRTLLTNTFNVQGMRTAQTDMSAGSLSYTPNALGEIVSQTDAKSQVTSFVHDALGRVTSRTELEGTTTWIWGTSSTAKNIGRLQSVAGPGYSESFAYDSAGRLQQKGISSDASYIIDYAYNSIGALSTLTYPTSTSSYRLKLQYDYQNGVLLRVKDFNAPSTVFWTGNDMDARGNIISESLGNGIQTVRGYDAVTGLPDYIQSSSGSTSIQNLSYVWDQVGNLTQRQDVRQGLSENFYYDNLYRLTSTTGADSSTSTYDARGNMLQRTGAPLASGNSHTISWYSYNLPNTIDSAGTNSSSQLFYAPGRSRWKQVASYTGTTEATIYIGGLVEKVTLGSVTSWKHVIAGASGPVAVYTRKSSGANEIHYLTTDSLGSIDSITSGSGSVEVRLSFGAFGQRRNEDNWAGNPTSGDWTGITNTTRHGYTGHEMLDNLNLTHMNGRVYDQLVGSFLSPDPFITEPGSTQGWNRYAYVKNNPLSHTDPSGFKAWTLHRRDPPGPGDALRSALGSRGADGPGYVCANCWPPIMNISVSMYLSSFSPRYNFNRRGDSAGSLFASRLETPVKVDVPERRPRDPGSRVGGNSRTTLISTVTFSMAQRDLARLELISDVEAAASISDFLAQQPHVTPERFITIYGQVLSGSTPADPAAGRTRPPLVPGFGQYGFRPDYVEPRYGPHNNNQVRHFVGYVVAGYGWSRTRADLALWYQERYRYDGTEPDYVLGVRGINLGIGIREGRIPLDRVGDWIRSNASE